MNQQRPGATAMVLAIALSAVWCGAPARSQSLGVEPELKVPAPELPEELVWRQSKPLTMQDLKGKVVLVDFWEYTCVNCIRTFPYLKAWHEKYREKGLVILGVHTPEFHFARIDKNVDEAVKRFGMGWPIIIDSDYRVWKSYGNRYWPAKYLIDKDGFVRYYHFGEGSYGDTEASIQKLLREIDPKVPLPALTEPVRGTDKPGAVCYPVTPELYMGYERGGHAGTLANREGYRPERTVTYKDPGKHEDGLVYVQGAWKNTQDALVSTRKTANPDYIAIRYHALEVNTVARPESGKPVRLYILHDDKPVAQADKGDDIQYDEKGRSYVLVDRGRMYNLIKNAKFGQKKLKLATFEPGMGIYSFTFSSCEVPRAGG